MKILAAGYRERGGNKSRPITGEAKNRQKSDIACMSDFENGEWEPDRETRNKLEPFENEEGQRWEVTLDDIGKG